MNSNFQKEIFIERFAKLREMAGETNKELQDVFGLSLSAVINYQTGKRTPDIAFLHKLAEHYDVSADYLLGLSDAKSTEQDIQIACSVTGLSEDSVKTLKEIVADTDHKYFAESSLHFLNAILENPSSPYSVSSIANMMKKVVDAKVQILLTEKSIEESKLERNETGQKMTSYEVGDVFHVVNLRDHEDITLLHFSRLLNSLAESIAKETIEQEMASNGKHHQAEE